MSELYKSDDASCYTPFSVALANLLNAYSKENGSNTPDWILRDYIIDSLAAFDRAVNARENLKGINSVLQKVEEDLKKGLEEDVKEQAPRDEGDWYEDNTVKAQEPVWLWTGPTPYTSEQMVAMTQMEWNIEETRYVGFEKGQWFFGASDELATHELIDWRVDELGHVEFQVEKRAKTYRKVQPDIEESEPMPPQVGCSIW